MASDNLNYTSKNHARQRQKKVLKMYFHCNIFVLGDLVVPIMCLDKKARYDA